LPSLQLRVGMDDDFVLEDWEVGRASSFDETQIIDVILEDLSMACFGHER